MLSMVGSHAYVASLCQLCLVHLHSCHADCGGFSGTATPSRWSLNTTAVNDWGTSLVWWSGENFGDHEILMHELGHTYGMGHGNVIGGCDLADQCDHTCTMGATGGQDIRCFNAPHNWQVRPVGRTESDHRLLRQLRRSCNQRISAAT
jgi:hypothetical protein